MADYRFVQIEEEFDTEDEEILIPERINLPVHDSNPIHEELEEDELEEDDSDDDDESDYDDDDDDDDYDDYDDDEEEDELLIPDIVLPINLDLINQLEDEEDDSDYEEEEEEDYEDDESYEEDGEVEEMIPVEMDRDFSSSVYGVGMDNVMMENSNEVDGSKEEVVNRCEIDGLICPICFEAWTSGGQHQISCLPCGHIYGFSCIKKWLLQRRSSGKCPQCNHLCTIKDVRVLYASRLCVADEELHNRVRSLEAKCAYLERKAAPLTHDELINQICSNPTLVERLATALADLH